MKYFQYSFFLKQSKFEKVEFICHLFFTILCSLFSFVVLKTKTNLKMKTKTIKKKPKNKKRQTERNLSSC